MTRPGQSVTSSSTLPENDNGYLACGEKACRRMPSMETESRACRYSWAGSGSIVAIALFLAGWADRMPGILTLFALQPWHIRYGAEARGYILMLLFFTLAIWALPCLAQRHVAVMGAVWRGGVAGGFLPGRSRCCPLPRSMA